MKNRRIIAFILFACLPMLANAGEKEQELIAKVNHAYGGDAVINLANFRLEERFLESNIGQSHTPNLTEVGTTTHVLSVDIKNGKAAYDTWTESRNGGYQNTTIGDGEGAYSIDFQAGTYSDAPDADPRSYAGGAMRTSDAVLVHELNKVKDHVTALDDEKYQNSTHHVLRMPFPQSPDLMLYIDAKTGLISKMLRVHSQLGNLDYVYSAYKTHNGVTYASSINFSVAGVPNLISTRHELQFNIDMPASTFVLPDGLSKEGDRIDTSEMLVNKISDRTYHVGQGSGYSLFVDTTMGVVAAGGYPDLHARFKRFQKDSENYKPLAYQVVTHHHSDHIGGVAEAVKLGARLITVDENVETIKEGVFTPLEDNNFFTVGPRTTLGDGRNRVQIYEVSTSHAASFLVTYVPQDKTVFLADHMGSPFANATPVASLSTVDMLNALDALNIDIKKIATAHSARIFTMQDMRNSVAAYKPTACLGGRPVCN